MENFVKALLKAVVTTLEDSHSEKENNNSEKTSGIIIPKNQGEMSSHSGERKQLSDSELLKIIAESAFKKDKYENKFNYYLFEYKLRNAYLIPSDEKATHEYKV